jgi:predicted GNAT family acetyltransferase
MAIDVQHDPSARVFVAVVDGHRCVLEYQLAGSTMTITHTGVPPAVGGRGIAGDLTRAAVDAARAAGWKIVPACSYARTFFERKPEYADLLA